MKYVIAACAIALTCLGTASPVQAQKSRSIGESLDLVRDQLSQQGQLFYTGVTYDSATGKSWTTQFSVEASNITVDPKQCRISFHWRTTADGKVVQDLDTSIPFRTATDVSLISMAEDISEASVRSGHGTWATSFQPQVWVVHVSAQDNHRFTVDFRDQATAQLVGDAMDRLLDLCQ